MQTSEWYKPGLEMRVFAPDGGDSEPRPGIVFFHGGGWRLGTPDQFQPQCRELAERGMVAASATYRLTAQEGITIADCVADARFAFRWFRANAARFGVDSARLAAGGGSAGGHVAACCALVTDPGLDDPNAPEEVQAADQMPDALVLFNPVLDLTTMKLPRANELATAIADSIETMDPDVQRMISPGLHVAPGAPPTLLQHGTIDPVAPIEQSRRFRDRMVAAGNRCELVEYEGESHGWFNQDLERTNKEIVRFLAGLGWIEG